MDDLISRETVRETLQMYVPGFKWDTIDKMVDMMPSAQPERKKGKWEAFMAYGKTVRHRCSECLAVAARDDFGNEYLSDYCTVCGADMRGEEDG